jgi:transposase-like protein
MGSKLILLKRDLAGRVRTPGELQAEAVAAYQRSGLSAKAFAQQCGIRYHTFWNWLHKAGLTQPRSKPEGGAVQSLMRLVEIRPQPTSEALRVELPSGSHLMVEHAGQLTLVAQLLKALA